MEQPFTLADLEKKATENREAQLAKYKRGYELARSLGFTSVEATILQGKDEDTIKRLAEERNNKKV